MTTTQADPRYELARKTLHELAGRTYMTPKDATTALQRLAEHFPMVAPGGTTQVACLPEGYGVQITSITPQETDVYKEASSGALCYHAKFLNKLASGLGVQFQPEKTRRLDNFAHPFVCALVVGGRYRDYTGEWHEVSASAQFDLRDEADHGVTKPAELKRMRSNIHELCETNAYSRLIAKANVERVMHPQDAGVPIVMAQLYRTAPVDPSAAREALYGGGAKDNGGDDISSAKPAEVVHEGTGEVSDLPRDTFPIPAKKGLRGEGKRLVELTVEDLRANVETLMARLNDTEHPLSAGSREVAERILKLHGEQLDWREKQNRGEWS